MLAINEVLIKLYLQMFCPCFEEQKKWKLHLKGFIYSWFWPLNCTKDKQNEWKKTLLIWGELNDFAAWGIKKRLFRAVGDRQTDRQTQDTKENMI